MHEKYIRDMFNRCSVSKLLGIEVTELNEGLARGRLLIRKEHLNVFGDVHGGIIYTFADQIAGACGNTLGKKAVLLESSIQYMKGVKGERAIFADAAMTHRGKTIGRIDVKVYEENGAVIALVHQIFFVKKDEHAAETPESL